MRVSTGIAIAACLTPVALGGPEPAASPAPTPAPNPGLVGGVLDTLNLHGDIQNVDQAVHQVVEGIKQDKLDAEQVISAYAAIITQHTNSRPAPTGVKQVVSSLSSVLVSAPTNIVGPAAHLVLNNADPRLNKAINGQFSGLNNHFDNINNHVAKTTIFPKRNKTDAPYSLSEDQLRKAIYFPPGYTFGEKPPVLLVPGTGSTGGDNFAGNLIPLLRDQSYADLVWINIPGYQLHDAQTNAEYVAHAISYVSAVSKNRQISVISWSQGGISVQWALKYWPSLRKVVNNFVATSPDYRGTVQAHFLCPGFPVLQCNPSVLQQDVNSEFIKVLRSDGGDSSYVPTTNIYSSFFDEIVQPQTGKGASGYLNNAHGAGVTNNEVQAICPGAAAGSFYTHEGVLYNPLTFHLVQDALVHGGAGQISRLNLKSICERYVTDGLSLADVLDTEATIPQAALNILFVQPHLANEPAIKDYAKKAPL